MKDRKKRGVALIMALWLLALLALLLSAMAFIMRLEPKMAAIHSYNMRALAAAQAGIDKAFAQLLESEISATIVSGTLTDAKYEAYIERFVIFGLRGNNKTDFWKCTMWEVVKDPPDLPAGIYINSWPEWEDDRFVKEPWVDMAPTPGTIKWGGALAHHYGPISGDSTDKNYLFALRGDSSGTDREFYRYDVSADSWTDLSATDPTPDTIGPGGALAYWYDTKGTASEADDDYYIYALRGRGTTGFFRYDITAAPGSGWTDLSATAPVPGTVKYGGSLAYARDPGNNKYYLYALRGASTLTSGETAFYRYGPLGDSPSWTTMTSVEVTEDGAPTLYGIGHGGALAWDGWEYLYALRGYNKQDFLCYDIENDVWEKMMGTPSNVQRGGALLYPGGDYFYAFKGGDAKTVFVYEPDIVLGTWQNLQDNVQNGRGGAVPEKVYDGGALCYPLKPDKYCIVSIGRAEEPGTGKIMAERKLRALVNPSATGTTQRIEFLREVRKD